MSELLATERLKNCMPWGDREKGNEFYLKKKKRNQDFVGTTVIRGAALDMANLYKLKVNSTLTATVL